MLGLVVFILVLLTFALLNVCTWRALRAFHPKRTVAIRAALIIGNIFWIGIILMIAARESIVTMVFRSTLGPPFFAWLIFVILYSVFVLILALIWLPFRKRVAFGRFGSKPSTLFLIVLGLLTVFGFYDATVPLRVARVPVQLQGLPPEFDGYRIALMSDLHVGLFSRPSRLRTIAAAAEAQNPNVIVVAGDLIDDDSRFTPKFVRTFERVRADVPVLAVLGNHEMYGDPVEVVRQLRAQQRVRLLLNEGIAVQRGGAALWLAGISDYAASDLGARGVPKELRPDLAKAMAGRPASAFPILLAHQPKAFFDAKAAKLPITLCGHSHGGQTGIRRLGWSLAGVFIPYHMGLYRDGASQLYVTTGAGYWLVPFRLGLPPEVVIIELKMSDAGR